MSLEKGKGRNRKRVHFHLGSFAKNLNIHTFDIVIKSKLKHKSIHHFVLSTDTEADKVGLSLYWIFLKGINLSA